MKILHLSYARIEHFTDPEAWIERINFYAGIIEAMGKRNDVYSIHCINYSGVITRNGVQYHFVKMGKRGLIAPVSLHKYAKALRPEAVIVHGLHFAWQVLLLRLQLGKGVHIFAQHHAEQPLRYHKKYLQKINDRFIKRYFFSSVDLALPWLRRGLIRDPSKVTEVMEASSVFHSIDKSEAARITRIHGSEIYLWVGRLDQNKDPVTLINGFKKFLNHNPKARLYVIFQQDNLLGEVKKRVDDCPQNIFLVGKVAHSELLYWFNSADFIISTSHYESGGIAVCEAMSCGCIPILSNIPSFRMMTATGKIGLLFRPCNSDDLYRALRRSASMDIATERQKVLCQFEKNLSFQSIADKITTEILKH